MQKLRCQIVHLRLHEPALSMLPTLDQQATLHRNVNADDRKYMMHACVHSYLPFMIANAFLTSDHTICIQ